MKHDNKNDLVTESEGQFDAFVRHTHCELVEIGYKWVLKKCGFAFKELNVLNKSGEIPDVIGFNSDGSFLLEAKASRSDYLKDKNKLFRQMPELGMGDWRFYIAPRGLISKDELPENWGLIEVNEKGKAFTTYNPFGQGNIYYLWKRCKKSVNDERQMMYSALRRLHVRNRLPEIYEKK